MALMKSAMWTSISGSIGGTTFAKSAQGYYARARVVPVNPATDQQAASRAPMTLLSARWSDTLTQFERDAWNLYAANVLVPGRDGTPQQISGQAHYIRSNSLLVQAANAFYTPLANLPAASAIIDTAPSTFDLGDIGALNLVSSVASSLATVGFDDSLAWCSEDDAFLFIFQGRPRSAGRKYFRGPWRLLFAVPGNNMTPVTSPGTGIQQAPAFEVIAGQVIRVAGVVVRADGRRSARVYSNDVVCT